MQKGITVIVDASGKIQVEAQGYKGSSCVEATRFIEEALGRVQARRKKPEYYQSSRVKQQVRT